MAAHYTNLLYLICTAARAIPASGIHKLIGFIPICQGLEIFLCTHIVLCLLGSITSHCSGNESALLPQGGT